MKQRGFSLMELAMVLGFTGLIVGLVFQTTAPNNAVATNDCYASSRIQVRTIQESVKHFALTHERLPRPAARNAGIGNSGYGAEAAAQTTPVSFGALPWQTLGLPGSFGSDCWGNKYTYMVTTALTTNAVSGGYRDAAITGNITLKNGALAATHTKIAYAIISHGKDALGAVKASYNGTDAGWCAGASRLPTVNCRGTDAEVAEATFNDGKDAGANYFDDVVLTAGKPQILVASGGSGSCTWAGGSVANGANVTAYQQVGMGPCSFETRTCTDGTLSGTYAATGCGGAGCTVDVAGVETMLADGESITRYASSTEGSQFGVCHRDGTSTGCSGVCANAQTATCNNGMVRGGPITYTEANCSVGGICIMPACGVNPGDTGVDAETN